MSDPYVPSLSHPVPPKSIVIADTVARTGLNAVRVQCLVSTQVATLSSPRKTAVEGYNGKTLAAGHVIDGPVTGIQLTSGAVEAHFV